jgi:hypothetical protein
VQFAVVVVSVNICQGKFAEGVQKNLGRPGEGSLVKAACCVQGREAKKLPCTLESPLPPGPEARENQALLIQEVAQARKELRRSHAAKAPSHGWYCCDAAWSDLRQERDRRDRAVQ